MARRVLQVPVIRARRTNRIGIASPSDFVRGRALAVEAPQAGAFPYCLDFERARTIYVPGIEARAVQAAPFYYLCLRRNARSFVSVPLEYGPLSGAADWPAPVFFFSPGRCGSTLLSQILFEAGIASVSEPDFCTQMSSQFWSSRYNPLREPFRMAMWNMTKDLVTALGAGHATVVKLRAECCRAPALFLRPAGERPRTLVVLRSFETWARSTSRVFRTNPGKAVRKYMRALRCYAFLERNSDCHLVHYEALLSDPVDACAALGYFLGVTIPAEAVVRAKKRDSQEDTPLKRGIRQEPAGWEARFDATMYLWHSPRLARARHRLGIQNVWSGAPEEGEKSLRTML